MTRKQKKWLVRIIVSAVLLVAANLIPVGGIWKFFIYIVPYLVIGHDILKNAFLGIIQGQVLDENFLMAIATVGAYIIAATRTGDYNEAVAVMLFYQIGEFFQSYAVGKSRKNITQLMDIRPDYANVEIDGEIVRTDPEELPVGSVITVYPGEKIPIDGVISEGESSLDTVALTGESIPKSVSVGDAVISGCINMTGLLKIRTTKEFGDSTVSKILDMVENASSRKSKSEAFISKFARVYTPVVCISALILAIVPPLVRLLFMGLSPDFGDWIYRALTFLVISCPCALVISIPLSFFAGIGGASNSGILIKGSNYFEVLAKADTVVFDKTGTLTKGVFEVTDFYAENGNENELFEIAALAESSSKHPIALSICKKYGKKADFSKVKNIREVSGGGVLCEIDGESVSVGNSKLMESVGVESAKATTFGTVVHVALGGRYLGYIVISDVVKNTSAQAIRSLKKEGITKTVMLTGDRTEVAKAVSESLGIDAFYSELLPDEKVETVENLLKDKKGSLIFVGDGINDAPVLSRSDVGIAMGAIGSDAAIESADVVLMDDDPTKVAKAIRISRKVMRIVHQNIVFAIGVKIVCLILGALGYANMWLAVFADVGVMVLAVLNAVRALFVKKL
ncbi:MAG: cadmium-translocating P-type ATPase [Clostridia bacterium]|nr:cadmium-translocating P-type ATPase [Clostridia bacterium]